jgi:glycosyltransferase involved in cell wall biosynthesis
MPDPATVPVAPGGASDVVVVVPCYNEGRRLPVREFHAFAAAHPGYAFLFVDDGSQDDTAQVLEAMRTERPGAFTVKRLARNSGKGEAVREGLLAAWHTRTPFLAYWDADLATPLDTLPAFREVFEHRPQVEIVLGSRVNLLGRQIERRPLRHYLGRVFATAASWALHLAVYDTQCGAKMFRSTEALPRVFGEPFTSRWIFDVELLARFLELRRSELPEASVLERLFELPLPVWKDVAGSKVKPTDFLVALVELIRIEARYPQRVRRSAPGA